MPRKHVRPVPVVALSPAKCAAASRAPSSEPRRLPHRGRIMTTFDEADAVARYQALVKVEIKNRLKADDQRLARALIVADAKSNLDAAAYKAFLEKIDCADSTSRELLKIAQAGTAADVRRATALRVAQYRERKAAAVTSPDVTAPPVAPSAEPEVAPLRKGQILTAAELASLNRAAPIPQLSPPLVPTDDTELAAYEFSYDSKERYKEMSERTAAQFGLTLPPMKEGRGRRVSYLYVPLAMAETLDKKAGRLRRVPVWAARTWETNSSYELATPYQFTRDAASTIHNLEDWQYTLDHDGEQHADRFTIDDNVIAGAKEAAERWAKLYETILQVARKRKVK